MSRKGLLYDIGAFLGIAWLVLAIAYDQITGVPILTRGGAIWVDRLVSILFGIGIAMLSWCARVWEV